MNNNVILNKAKKRKQDEFYTQYEDVEKELSLHDFSGKVVYCPCDDYNKSAFVKYFLEHFNLKMLITSCLEGHFMMKTQESTDYWEGDGDFYKCARYFNMADCIVTNPPFSLFQDFFRACIGKKFLVLGPLNAVTYKDVFPYFKSGEVFFGSTIHGGDVYFKVPKSYSLDAAKCGIAEDGSKYIRVPGVRWYANFDRPYHPPLELTKHYDEEAYPKYDDCDAINVGKTKDIPCDYDGVMGVPITFLDKYNPEQFEIVGKATSPHLKGKSIYKRVFIRYVKSKS